MRKGRLLIMKITNRQSCKFTLFLFLPDKCVWAHVFVWAKPPLTDKRADISGIL